MSDTRKAHVHAESMRLYAEDAADTDKPWKRWEGKNILHHSWFNCCQHPNWSKDFEYRRNPSTINIKELESERDALRAEVERLKAISKNQGWVPLQSVVWPERLEWEGGWAPVLPEEGIIYIQIKNERMQFQVLNGKKS